MSIISNVLANAGQHIWNSLTEDSVSSTSRNEQLQKFENRLDYAINPEKAAFKQFLDENFVSSMEGVNFLSQKLENGILSDPQLAKFVAQNGGLSSDYSIEQRGFNYVLTSESGNEYVVGSNTDLSERVGNLYRLESVKQLAALQPGLNLDTLVDQSFQRSNNATVR